MISKLRGWGGSGGQGSPIQNANPTASEKRCSRPRLGEALCFQFGPLLSSGSDVSRFGPPNSLLLWGGVNWGFTAEGAGGDT